MNPTAVLAALSAVFLIKTVSCSDLLFVESSADHNKDQVKTTDIPIAVSDSYNWGICADSVANDRKQGTEMLNGEHSGMNYPKMPFFEQEIHPEVNKQVSSLETPIETENLKSNNELEIEKLVSRAQNGKFVFVESSGGNCDLYTISSETEVEPRPIPMHINENDLIKGKDQGLVVTFMMPKFSPDGSKIAFSRTGKKRIGVTIYTMDQDGQNLKEIGNGHSPCFTPDGQRIVYSNSPNHVFTCDLNGGDKKTLIKNGPNAHFADIISCINFTPDGNGIYFIQNNFLTNCNDLKIANAVTGQISKIVNGVERASFSPDGKYIVFINLERGIRIMDVESGSIFVDLPGERFSDVIWSPDGHKIFYRKLGHCGLCDIKFVDGRPVLENFMERTNIGAADFAWQSLPI